MSNNNITSAFNETSGNNTETELASSTQNSTIEVSTRSSAKTLTKAYYVVKDTLTSFFRNVTETCYSTIANLQSAGVTVDTTTLPTLCNASETLFNTRIGTLETSIIDGYNMVYNTLYVDNFDSGQANYLTQTMSTGLMQADIATLEAACGTLLPWKDIKWEYCPQLSNTSAIQNCKNNMDAQQVASAYRMVQETVAFNAAPTATLNFGAAAVVVAYTAKQIYNAFTLKSEASTIDAVHTTEKENKSLFRPS